MPDLKGKVAIVTGGATGIGAETCRTLARYGASVVVAGHRREDAEALAEEIRADGGTAAAAGVEVADEAQVAAMVEFAVEQFGGLDALHNNAAGIRGETMAHDVDVVGVSSEVWDRTMAVNLRGPFLCCKYAIPEMLKRGGGAIVNTSSVTGLSAEASRVSYGVSKAGLHGLTRHVAYAYGKQNIRCNALAVNLVVTDQWHATLAPAVIDSLKQQNALDRVGRTEDVAEFVAFLFSDLGSYLTGAAIPVDGGVMSHLPVPPVEWAAT